MKVLNGNGNGNGNGHIAGTGSTPHATLRRRPALRIVELGGSDTESAIVDTVDENGKAQSGASPLTSIAIVPSIGTGAESASDGECTEPPRRNAARDGSGKDARRGAARHARRTGYALLSCCAAWAACSAMGADFGLVNAATGQGAATLAAFIVAAAIAKKAVSKK